MRVAVTAGYSQSLHAIALIHRLAQEGHEVALVLQVRMLGTRRLRGYLRQLGWRALIGKARARLLRQGRSDGYERELRPMRELLAAHDIRSRTVHGAAAHVHAEHVVVRSLDAPETLASLRQAQPDLVIYAGGGIIRREFLEIPRLGVINAHGGPLPCFRGMNAVEWPLLHGVRPSISVYRVDDGLDTGPVLLRRDIPLPPASNVLSLRGEATRTAMDALIETVRGLQENKLVPQPQAVEQGRQFFVMAAPLVEVIDRWLQQGRLPETSAAQFKFPTGA